MKSNLVKTIISAEMFTSELAIHSYELVEKKNLNNILMRIRGTLLCEVSNPWSIYEKTSIISQWNNLFPKKDEEIYKVLDSSQLARYYKEEGLSTERIIKMMSYSGRYYDLTSILKGYALKLVAKILEEEGVNSYIASFGKDILGHNSSNTKIFIEGRGENSFTFTGDFVCFTSGNSGRRGEHIVNNPGVTSNWVKTATVFAPKLLPILADFESTQCIADPDFKPTLNYIRFADPDSI